MVQNRDGIKICETYSNHGHCPSGQECEDSHDIDVIIAYRDRKKRKRKLSEQQEEPPPKVKESNGRVVTTGGHRAGFDAFMTGYSLVAYLIHNNDKELTCDELKNKVHLVHKTKPLLIYKSDFAKVSQSHSEKFAMLKSSSSTN